MSIEVLCVGEALIAFVPADGVGLGAAVHFSTSIGGAESNVALGLAAFEHIVEWSGVVGDDEFGGRVLNTLEGGGVVAGRVRRTGRAPTAVYFKPGDGGAVRYYRQSSAGSRLRRKDFVRLAKGPSPRVVHTSGVSAQTSASARDALRFLVADRPFANALLSFDVNHRPLLSRRRTPDDLRRLASASDVVFVGRDEAERLWGTATAEDIRALLPGPRWLIVKDAEREAVEFDEKGVTRAPSPAVAVAEPTGAGDAFAAGWLSAFLRGRDGEERLQTGHRAAARVLGAWGDHLVRETPAHV